MWVGIEVQNDYDAVVYKLGSDDLQSAQVELMNLLCDARESYGSFEEFQVAQLENNELRVTIQEI